MDHRRLDSRFFPLVLDVVGQGVFTVDRDGRITSFNRAAERLTGLHRADVLGRDCHEVFPRKRFCGGDCSFCNGGVDPQGHVVPKKSQVTFRQPGGAELELAFELRVVSRPNEYSGVWRVPDVNSHARNYYLIVEAVDAGGNVLRREVRNEEDGRVYEVKKWGIRVDQATFDEIGPPSIDDIQWNDFPGGRTISFSGYNWRVKGPGIYGPGPNRFSDAADIVWVDAGGQHHLDGPAVAQHHGRVRGRHR